MDEVGWYVPAGLDHCPRCKDVNFDSRRRCATCTDGDSAYADGLFAAGWSQAAGEAARARYGAGDESADWCAHLPGGLDAARAGLVAEVCGQIAGHPVHRPVGPVPVCPPSSYWCRCRPPSHAWRIARCVWSEEYGSRPRPVQGVAG